MTHQPGLKHIPTERLKALLRLVVAGKVVAPVNNMRLHLAGFSDVGDVMSVLYGLDQAGLRAALVIALAERS
ncbi:MAG: hypothetical protein ABI321_02295 [Polyangia bacterium]